MGSAPTTTTNTNEMPYKERIARAVCAIAGVSADDEIFQSAPDDVIVLALEAMASRTMTPPSGSGSTSK